MERVSFTQFVDFILDSGAPKASSVREHKEHGFDPRHDFYRPLREGIVDMHRYARASSSLGDLVVNQPDERKRRLYPPLIAGYRKFLEGRHVRWLALPKASLGIGGVEITINPDLALLIEGKPHLLKTWFRSDTLSQKRVALVAGLMEKALSDRWSDAAFGMLDVKNGRLRVIKEIESQHRARLDLLLAGEAAAFSTMLSAA